MATTDTYPDPGFIYSMADCGCNGHCSNDAAKANPVADNDYAMEGSIRTFNDSYRESTIEEALDKAYPVFQLFGWTYYDGQPGRAVLEQVLQELTDHALDELRDDGTMGVTSSARFSVTAYYKETEGLTVNYDLNLSEGYGSD